MNKKRQPQYDEAWQLSTSTILFFITYFHIKRHIIIEKIWKFKFVKRTLEITPYDEVLHLFTHTILFFIYICFPSPLKRLFLRKFQNEKNRPHHMMSYAKRVRHKLKFQMALYHKSGFFLIQWQCRFRTLARKVFLFFYLYFIYI